MIIKSPPVYTPPFDPRKFPRLELPWTITGKVVQDFAPYDGIPDVIIKALDAATNQEVARTLTKAKGDYSLDVPPGTASGYLIRPERTMYIFMPTFYRVYESRNLPNFTGHNNK